MKLGSRLPESDPELNLIPLIDVIFVLIIFFVATTTFNQRSTMKLQLPTAQAMAEPVPGEPLNVLIDAQGHYFIGENEVLRSDVDSLKEAIVAVAGQDRSMPVVLRADARLAFGLAERRGPRAAVDVVHRADRLAHRLVRVAEDHGARAGDAVDQVGPAFGEQRLGEHRMLHRRRVHAEPRRPRNARSPRRPLRSGGQRAPEWAVIHRGARAPPCLWFRPPQSIGCWRRSVEQRRLG